MKGIIFDMDGTMVDNMMTHHRAWQRKLAALGLDMPLEEVKEKIHGVNTEILERLFGNRFTLDERMQISQEKEAEYRKIFRRELRLLDGLPELLEELARHRIPMAIGSAAPPENVDFVLDELNLRHYFKGVFHAGSVSRGKPDPEIFEKAAESMGLPARDCLVFEDSPTGAEAARRAGSAAVILTTTHNESEFRQFPNIKKFLSDFSGVTVEALRKW
ncbi:MAG: HAD family phosphatase [Phaeodactylibacter sp.]|nr:HAD family phosphatase [Phaeodactylibacter sp.]MCB9048247.1 HAD family phosphatase [Lewinellaceae bacterium]